MKLVCVSEGVYYPEQFVIVDSSVTSHLVEYANETTRNRSRLCAHPDANATLHEMLIVHPYGTYVRPHRHLNKSESLHIIEGAVSVFFFDDLGRVTKKIDMGEYNSGLPFFYRIDEPVYHSLLIRSEMLIFHEVTGGPFLHADTEFPSWGPDNTDIKNVERFQAKLMAT